MGLEDFTVPPSERNKPKDTAAAVTTPVTEVVNPTTAQNTVVPNQTEPATVAGATEAPKADEFFDTFNKRFSTTFKADDEVRSVLGAPLKIAELEGKAKLAEDYAKKIESYEQQLEEIKNKDNSEFLSKPLIRKAYVADQLLAKYPDKDPFALQEIVMADVDKLSDIDVIVKNQKINHPKLSEADIKSALLRKHGIDSTTPPEEWDSVVKAELTMDADDARANIKTLTNGIELPKTVTKEQREKDLTEAAQRRIQQTEPLKAKFLDFDKLKIGDFEYDVPAEAKGKLPDMFQGAFIDAGLEATEENLNTAIEMRNAQFLYNNFPKIREIISKQAQTEIQKKLDEALNNTKPPNTATASDDSTSPNSTRPGLGKLLEDLSK
jgi:hypothetical protein